MPEFRRQDFLKNLSKQGVTYDWVLLASVLVLTIGGLAFLASGLSVKGPAVFQFAFQKQFLSGVWIGGVLAFILARVDYHIWFKYIKTILIITFTLLAFLATFALVVDVMSYKKSAAEASKIRDSVIAKAKFLPIRPYQGGGAIRWVEIPKVLNFQPSELVKLVLLVYLSSVLLKYEDQTIDWQKIKKPLYVFGFAAALILLQPDLGSVLLAFGILLTAMWVSKVPMKIIATILLVVAVLGVTAVFSAEYRLKRVNAFLSQDSEKAAQIYYVRLAIQNGGLWGKGYGNSEYKQKELLFESTTDGIISIIGEEMGFVFVMFFLSLYLVFLFRGLKISKDAPDVGGRALAAGIAVWITTQAFLNIGGITGMIPLKGLPLPFVSAGGSSIIMNFISVGILLNISSQSVKNAALNFKKQSQFTDAKISNRLKIASQKNIY